MAEAAACPSTPLPAALPVPGPLAVREQWEVKFSRYFIFQMRHSPTVDAALRPISMSRAHFGRGTWLTASSPATILIVKSSSSDVAVLSVSVSGYIHEEHVVSSLQLTWPQVACVPQCPIRGSRVVFMSYTDSSNQILQPLTIGTFRKLSSKNRNSLLPIEAFYFASEIQKFQVRFLTCADAENFIVFFKNCSRNTMDFAQPASDFLCGNSSPSEMIASNALQYKFNEGENYEEAITGDLCCPAFSQNESYCPSPLLADSSNNTVFSGHPPSFTELLTNCSKHALNEINKQQEETNDTFKSGESAPHLTPQNATEQPVFDADIKNEIARYLSDASFYDLVFKIEKVVQELGGDLPL